MTIEAPIKQRRRLWKYIAALTALQEAEEGIAYIATRLGNHDENDSLVNCLWTGVVSSYCRPFTHNNNVGPIDIGIVPEGKKRKVHDVLWAMRNKLAGHTDHKTKLDDGSPMFPIAIEMIDGELCAHCSGARPDVVVAPDVLMLVKYVKEACAKRWPELVREITPVENLPLGRLNINLAKDDDSLFTKI